MQCATSDGSPPPGVYFSLNNETPPMPARRGAHQPQSVAQRRRRERRARRGRAGRLRGEAWSRFFLTMAVSSPPDSPRRRATVVVSPFARHRRRQAAPRAGATIEAYNSNGIDRAALRAELRAPPGRYARVPHARNRAVLFPSTLWHEARDDEGDNHAASGGSVIWREARDEGGDIYRSHQEDRPLAPRNPAPRTTRSEQLACGAAGSGARRTGSHSRAARTRSGGSTSHYSSGCARRSRVRMPRTPR